MPPHRVISTILGALGFLVTSSTISEECPTRENALWFNSLIALADFNLLTSDEPARFVLTLNLFLSGLIINACDLHSAICAAQWLFCTALKCLSHRRSKAFCRSTYSAWLQTLLSSYHQEKAKCCLPASRTPLSVPWGMNTIGRSTLQAFL